MYDDCEKFCYMISCKAATQEGISSLLTWAYSLQSQWQWIQELASVLSNIPEVKTWCKTVFPVPSMNIHNPGQNKIHIVIDHI